MKPSFKLFHILLVIFLCVSQNGCVFLLIGGAGAVGGYALTRDTFEGVSSKSQEELMASAHKVLSIMGIITEERPKEGLIFATISGTHVTVEVIQINLNTCKLRVKSRQMIFPRVGVAQEIYTKIMNQLDQ